MSIRVMTYVWQNSTSKSEALLVLLALADFADDDGVCWPKMRTLAEKARVTERGARGIVADLEASGQIRRTIGRGRGRHNAYQVVTDKRNEVPISLADKTGTRRQENRNGVTGKPERGSTTPLPVRNLHKEPSGARVVDKYARRTSGLRSIGSILNEAQRAAR